MVWTSTVGAGSACEVRSFGNRGRRLSRGTTGLCRASRSGRSSHRSSRPARRTGRRHLCASRHRRGRCLVGGGDPGGVEARTLPHNRFGHAAYCEGMPRNEDDDGIARSRIWMLDPDIAYHFPTDGGLTMGVLCADANRRTYCCVQGRPRRGSCVDDVFATGWPRSLLGAQSRYMARRRYK